MGSESVSTAKTGAALGGSFEPDFRVLIEHSLDMLTVLDAEGTVLYKSSAIRRELGFFPREIVGRRVFDFVHPDDVARARQAFAAAIAEPLSRKRLEIRFRHRSGSWVTLEAILSSRLHDPRVRGVVSSSRNITERIAAEAALRESSEALQTIILSAPVAIVSIDAEARTRIWNPAAESIFGWPAAEVVGREPPFFVDDADRQDFRARLAAVVRGEQVEYNRDAVRRRKDGTRVDVRVWARASRDALGRPDGLITFVEDISAFNAAQEALRRSEEHLDHARRMDAIGRLAGGIAHDFNNLLTAIQGNLQLAELDVPPDAPFREELSEIGRAVQRATELTRQLLAFSRKQVRRTQVVEVNHTVRETARLLRRLIGENVSVRTSLAKDLAPVEADPAQLEQVLVNLVVNARDAMPGGGVVTIRTRNATLGEAGAGLCAQDSADAPAVLLSVADTGEGMDPATRARAFEPFFTTKPPGKGTGLGLATVYGIVKQSGGYIWLDSRPGEGTTVSLLLPAVDAPAGREQAGGAHARTGAAPAGRGETILLVEDEAAVRQLAERVLSKAGYSVVATAGGEEAIQRAHELSGGLDLLLTDVVMPGLSGPEIAEQVSALHPRVRVLFTSGYSDEAISRHGVLKPGVSLLEKPFSVEALLERVRRTLTEPG
jgi:two-component system cell cycle sensor histidine kinase/response regulator CckA